ncbi:TniB family NTP-binding protein [Azospirillum sp. B506]|uniref:TniB family NTP-binding protein n=1 Tax=Azospirillum sp. B506 TaxID=137721 RepID=UPI000679E7E1|nr:TniB family NTP-binding protein [Azospirillum sp. B506]
MSDALEHIHPAFRDKAMAGDEERIALIRSDRWIGHPTANTTLLKLEEMLTGPIRARMDSLLITGESGMGKTMIIEKFLRQHPQREDQISGTLKTPIVSIQMAPTPGEKRLYVQILDALNVDTLGRMDKDHAATLCLRLMKAMGVRMLVIDEVHNLLCGTVQQGSEARNTIKFLSNGLRIPVVCAGTPEAARAIRQDVQLANRMHEITLPRWRDDTTLQRLLNSIVLSLPLRRPSPINDPKTRKLILGMSEGITVRLFRLLEAAAVQAIRTQQECIDFDLLDTGLDTLPLVSMASRDGLADPYAELYG